MTNTQRRRVLVLGGDTMINFSGSAFYFMQSLQEELPDFDVEPVPIGKYRDFLAETLKWGLIMRTDPRKYFFMMREFQEANTGKILPEFRETDIFISFTMIAPKKQTLGGARVFLFLDMTHHQYLGYSQFHDIPDRIKKEIIQQEEESYAAADRIFVFTEAVRSQLLEHYAVPDEKIEVIGRGLNLPRAATGGAKVREREVNGHSTIRVGFVGVDFARKGLPELIEAIDGSTALRGRVEIEVLGPDIDALPARPYLRAHGYLSKEEDLSRICEIMASCDIGYLFSKSEGIPGSVLEFLSMGVPCIISDIPAMSSIKDLPGIISLPLEGGVPAVGRTLQQIVASPSYLHDLRKSTADLDFDGWRPQAKSISRWCRV